MKSYLVTFAKGTPQEVTYPVEAASKQEAKREFSRQYIGRVDSTLCDLLKVTRDEESEEEDRFSSLANADYYRQKDRIEHL